MRYILWCGLPRTARTPLRYMREQQPPSGPCPWASAEGLMPTGAFRFETELERSAVESGPLCMSQTMIVISSPGSPSYTRSCTEKTAPN